ncbi:hypothetical protein SUGI_0662360 [Cryptomeria japonica]|uniref:transcription factor bHLH35 isoform X2 n=1 Tax=Cryptomeria japonica TaxID=3369 RepID=UPI002414A00C|nr:transcription factor bHLH35 isoform X2 [Cryptomeria japonica]GLJ32889.1 hypothetical protein SUGI_0662360 [Cryptomeria japonica]
MDSFDFLSCIPMQDLESLIEGSGAQQKVGNSSSSAASANNDLKFCFVAQASGFTADHENPQLHSFSPLGRSLDASETSNENLMEMGNKEGLLWAAIDGRAVNSEGSRVVNKQEDCFSDDSDLLEGRVVKSWDGARLAAAKNLVSERKRRRKLNERLYALRSLVPYITKMDKASIIADAIKYIQDLQRQARDIEAEIAALHSNNECSSNSSSLTSATADVDDNNDHSQDVNCYILKPNLAAELRFPTLQIDIFKIEERTFHIRIHCKKEPRVLVHLAKAIESVQLLEIQNSNATCFDGHIINTVIGKIKEVQEILEPDTLKHVLMDTASKYGFCTR